MTTRQIKAVAEAIKDSIRDNSGGHALTNMLGDSLWYPDQPVNISQAAKAAIEAYEATKELQTISGEAFEEYEWNLENCGARIALATLGITVEGE